MFSLSNFFKKSTNNSVLPEVLAVAIYLDKMDTKSELEEAAKILKSASGSPEDMQKGMSQVKTFLQKFKQDTKEFLEAQEHVVDFVSKGVIAKDVAVGYVTKIATANKKMSYKEELFIQQLCA